uniref:Ectonucleoside triphosphate diphosphohydrolase 6 (Putative function) n=1 Tax=Nothobranchius furzeri TaxID=105023 RepID=A0A8C6LI86_NOTFU
MILNELSANFTPNKLVRSDRFYRRSSTGDNVNTEVRQNAAAGETSRSELYLRCRLAGLFLLGGCVMVYLVFVKHHYSTHSPHSHRPPPHPQPRAHRTKPDGSSSADGDSFQYGVMFDAGSTGTRVHVFRFQLDFFPTEPPKLDHETFRAIKPGLSAYADDPQKCSAGLVELLDMAKSSVPPSMWIKTPVILKATAGLRLLPGQKADQLLDRVRHTHLSTCSFPFCSNKYSFNSDRKAPLHPHYSSNSDWRTPSTPNHCNSDQRTPIPHTALIAIGGPQLPIPKQNDLVLQVGLAQVCPTSRSRSTIRSQDGIGCQEAEMGRSTCLTSR